MSALRHLKSEEVGLCIEGGKQFFDEGKIPGGFVPEIFTRTWKTLIVRNVGTIIGSFVGETITGALGALLAPDLNNGQTTAIECFWFVIPEHRGGTAGMKLLREFERWAQFNRARRVAMIHLTGLQPERLGELYDRCGYQMVETHYVKEL